MRRGRKFNIKYMTVEITDHWVSFFLFLICSARNLNLNMHCSLLFPSTFPAILSHLSLVPLGN